MEASKPAPQSSSRIVVIAVVCLLLVVAIAGIVLARRGHAPRGVPLGNLSATRPPAAVASSTRTATFAPTPSGGDVLFDPASDKVSAEAKASIDHFVESTRGRSGMVRMTARFVTGENKARDAALAKSRTTAVRQRLQQVGVKPEQMQMELIEMPGGTLAQRDADRVELSLH